MKGNEVKVKKIQNWENVQEPTKFKRLAPGGYICAIKDVKDVAEKEYLEIQFDIVKGEEKGYFQKQYDNDKRENKKWPASGTMRRYYNENSESFFKGFITSVEKSNKNFAWNWDETKLKNKYFGAVIGEQEYVNQKGGKSVALNVVAIHSVETIENGDFQIPSRKELDVTKVTNQQQREEFKDYFNDEVSPEDMKEAPFDDDGPSPFDR